MKFLKAIFFIVLIRKIWNVFQINLRYVVVGVLSLCLGVWGPPLGKFSKNYPSFLQSEAFLGVFMKDNLVNHRLAKHLLCKIS